MSPYEYALQPFVDYGFMRRALVACAALALSGAPLGVFLVLRRMTLAGDAMSHAILPGASIAFLFFGLSLWPMTIGGLIAGLLVALGAGAAARFTLLKEDASFTGAYLLSLAAGVLIISMSGNTIDLVHVLFGNVLAVDNRSLFLLAGISSVSLFALALIYRNLILECFDPGFMRSVQGKGGWMHQIFLVLAVLNLVAAFQALGTLMAIGIMVLPAIAARFWTKSIDISIGLSIGLAFFSAYVGLLLSYHYGFPSGPAIVLMAGLLYVFSLLFGRYGSVLARLRVRRHYAG